MYFRNVFRYVFRRKEGAREERNKREINMFCFLNRYLDNVFRNVEIHLRNVFHYCKD